MFTVNVVHRGPHGPDRTVHECQSYEVTYAEGRASAVLVLTGPEPVEIRLACGERAFVMNAEGSTVDVIRTRESSCG